jgi:alkanesulfonate monooxygenase SsuD/methylene tetrahydromethanopterin reductase-like flavin-dependent oxidoreductase (luciferase family)
MKLSMMLNGGGGTTVRDVVSLSREAEQAGVNGVYLPEAWRSGFVTLTAIAAATTELRVGPYVLNAHARTPMIAGMSAVDLDEFSGGRLVLGIGSGNKITNESYQGVPVVRPLEKMRDYVQVVRGVTHAHYGDRVDFEGPRHQMTGWHAQVEPVRESIPIYLAATGPKMTELAGDVADGIALGSLLSAPFITDIATRLRSRVGEQFGVMAASFLSVDEDVEAARSAARDAVVNLYAGKPHPHYDALLREQGHVEVADAITEAVAADDLRAAHDAVTDAVVDTLTIAGTAEDCLARLKDYSTVVDELLLMSVSSMRYQAGDRGVGEAQAPSIVYGPLLELVKTASQ